MATSEETERLYEEEYGYDPDKRMSPTRPQETRKRFICYDCKLWDSLARKCRGDEWDRQECKINKEE